MLRAISLRQAGRFDLLPERIGIGPLGAMTSRTRVDETVARPIERNDFVGDGSRGRTALEIDYGVVPGSIGLARLSP